MRNCSSNYADGEVPKSTPASWRPWKASGIVSPSLNA